MAVIVWVATGIALWHFTVFVPDRFRGGIVGAFAVSTLGAIASGGIVQILIGEGLGHTNLATVLAATPGTAVALAILYVVGVRAGEQDPGVI